MTPATALSPGIAWITGAGTGIGRGLAKRLARDGWQVAASALTLADLTSLAREVAEARGAIHPFPLDVTRDEDVAAAITKIEADLGPIDLAVLNAGTYLRFGAGDFSTEAFRQQVEVNLMGVVHGLDALLPTMMARRSGHIAVVSSLAGYCGLPKAAGYGATKAALINLCESLRPECAAAGVAVTVINPGFVKTPLTDKNEFPMPFLISVDQAVEAIMRGLARQRFEIAFPLRFAWLMKLLGALPYPLFFSITRRLAS
jgi:NAD(P)-dependent dehydrogenase (short-subunit alcohol dehydrogenase family)